MGYNIFQNSFTNPMGSNFGLGSSWSFPGNMNAGNQGNTFTNPTFNTGGGSSGGGSSSGGGMSKTGGSHSRNWSDQNSWDNSSSFSRSHDQALTDADQAMADAFLAQLLSGGTAEQKAEIQNRKNTQALIQSQLENYTTDRAFADAKGAMSQQLRQSLEKNMPAISRGAEGAGSSAGSMQALLSNDLATRAAEGAAALGAQQAQAYGGITANIDSTLERISQPMNLAEQTLVQALQAVKGPHSDSYSESSHQGGSQGHSEGYSDSEQYSFNPQWWYQGQGGGNSGGSGGGARYNAGGGSGGGGFRTAYPAVNPPGGGLDLGGYNYYSSGGGNSNGYNSGGNASPAPQASAPWLWSDGPTGTSSYDYAPGTITMTPTDYYFDN